jgi:hypothetical protein
LQAVRIEKQPLPDVIANTETAIAPDDITTH